MKSSLRSFVSYWLIDHTNTIFHDFNRLWFTQNKTKQNKISQRSFCELPLPTPSPLLPLFHSSWVNTQCACFSLFDPNCSTAVARGPHLQSLSLAHKCERDTFHKLLHRQIDLNALSRDNWVNKWLTSLVGFPYKTARQLNALSVEYKLRCLINMPHITFIGY